MDDLVSGSIADQLVSELAPDKMWLVQRPLLKFLAMALTNCDFVQAGGRFMAGLLKIVVGIELQGGVRQVERLDLALYTASHASKRSL